MGYFGMKCYTLNTFMSRIAFAFTLSHFVIQAIITCHGFIVITGEM
jgi:hypothetical protein